MKRRNYFKGLSNVIGAFYTAHTPTVSPLASRSFEVQFSSLVEGHEADVERETCATGEVEKREKLAPFLQDTLLRGLR